ncbi:MAG: sulfide/dihydroorotate dehydrogenase-like FAD/NAD-binding protein [Chloroflexi bacterium]|nr:sulfide/dihydroorotate dehydrogenase-like FAD/NAD-binding protein [Chloroflexota bacterium]
MPEIVRREEVASRTILLEIAAPEVARKAQAGQFVVVIPDERGERIPLTLADWDPEAGTITIVFLVVGTSTQKLAWLATGDSVAHLAGPLGRPTEVENFGTVAVVGGGVGLAAVFPIARALKDAGNRVITVMGARCRELIFWEDRLCRVSDELIITTDDGSYGRKGVVTQPLQELLQAGQRLDRVIAVGPTVMMRFVAKTTQPFGVKTIVSLNPLMLDATGMCGVCRVRVGELTKFACVDGPDFDAHKVDWELLKARQRSYCDEEKCSLERLEHLAPKNPGEGGHARA